MAGVLGWEPAIVARALGRVPPVADGAVPDVGAGYAGCVARDRAAAAVVVVRPATADEEGDRPGVDVGPAPAGADRAGDVSAAWLADEHPTTSATLQAAASRVMARRTERSGEDTVGRFTPTGLLTPASMTGQRLRSR